MVAAEDSVGDRRCAVRMALAAAWHLHLAPTSPHLLDAVLRIPLMDVSRARTELGWSPRYSGVDAMRELLRGLQESAGMPTPPLDPHAGGRARQHEIRTGVGTEP